MTKSITNPQTAKKSYAPGSSRLPRSVRTLALQMARADDERARARGERIRELRGGVPQPRIAEQVDVTLRAYQEWEAGGGIAWDNLERLAEVHSVSPEYIEYGVAGRPRPGTDIERLEGKLDHALALLDSLLRRLDSAGITLADEPRSPEEIAQEAGEERATQRREALRSDGDLPGRGRAGQGPA